MTDTGTKAKARPRGVNGVIRWRLATTLAIAVSMLAFTALIAPPVSATAGDLAGTWTSVDYDGSNQTLEIKGAGNSVYSMFLRDDIASRACDDSPAKVVGQAVKDGNTLFMRGTLVCLHRGNPFPGERIHLTFKYHAGTDTLTDFTGLVWERAD